MQIDKEFLAIVEELKEHSKEGKEIELTPRKLLSYFGFERRTTGNVAIINDFFQKNKIETDPDYVSVWIDAPIILKSKKKAKTKKEIDPIQRIKLLDAANKKPLVISKEATLEKAITLMMMHNYSQLPVMSGERSVDGVITWETIGMRLVNGKSGGKVLDFMKKDVNVLDYETPLMDAISIIIEEGFVLVKKSDKTICGIVTIADISKQFLNLTGPFLLLEQIEKKLRQMLDGKFTIDELKTFCKISEPNRKIEFIDDLTFGEYIRIIENPKNWEKLKLQIDRDFFVEQLHKVREIRNDIMHFDPEGITEEQKQILLNMSDFLLKLNEL